MESSDDPTVMSFLTHAFRDVCPRDCFDRVCRVSTLLHPRVASVLERVAEFVASGSENETRPLLSATNCQLIAASLHNVDPAEEKQKNRIFFYLDCMVELGLLLRTTEASSVHDVQPDWIGSVETIVDDVPLPYYVLYNGEPIRWTFISSQWHAAELPNEFTERFPSWNPSECLELAKLLFWFLRKVVVDTLLASMMPLEAGCLALSAGSIQLTSDYDVNVYGTCSEWVSAFFQKECVALFGHSSDVVFDTNIYSSSFMDLVRPSRYPERYLQSGCGPYRFWYVNVDATLLPDGEILTNDQHLWAMLKLANALVYIIEKHDDTLPPMIRSEVLDMYETLEAENATWTALQSLIATLDRLGSPEELIFEGRKMRLGYRDFVNHLSLINYRGNETYYTRGAFLDVVVNQQMCQQGNGQSLPGMDENVYFDSMIENLGDFCQHDGKLKYRHRVAHARGHLIRMATNAPEIFTHLDDFLRGELFSVADLLMLGWVLCTSVLNQPVATIAKVHRYAMSLRKMVTGSMMDL